ncbi:MULTISPECIES: protein kinase family protein [Dactylosporangium]|uniref:Serine/threonine protein kinase n=2 Tax=Dactylosporangium TaxID=35753 RepID=A0A9W6KGJ4_9ACTN|nr:MULTISPECIES: protein kinase family protein [Dactylosporangium]GLK99093.1 serine/threonine protein kinase [Dactylosporangium matsuzakiense]
MAELDEGLEAGGVPRVLTFGTPSVGEILAERYQLEEHIGNDSLGRQLYRGIDVILRRPVAVVTRYPGGESAKEMLAAAVAASRIVHPHLVGVYDAIDEGERAYVVREWVDGIALRDIVAQGPLDAGRSVAIAWAVTDAVAALHGTGMAHGNVHPGTVLVAHDGRVVLTDARADDRATPDTDIRSIGAILYCALTGYWPHAEAGTYSVPDGVRDESGALQSPRQVRSGVPAHLDSLIADLLNPEMPLPSAESLGAELASFGSLDEEEIAAEEQGGRTDFAAFDSASQSTTPPKPAGRKLAVGVVGLLVLALAGTLAAARVLGDPASPEASPPGASAPAGTTASQPAKPAGQPVEFKIDGSKVRIVDPQGDRTEVKDADKAVDGDANTVWKTERYPRADFGGKKAGMGIWIDLGEEKQVANVQVVLQTPGADGELRAGSQDLGSGKSQDAATVQGYPVVNARQGMGSTTVFTGPEQKTRYLLVWITKLPKESNSGGYRVAIGEITVRVQ